MRQLRNTKVRTLEIGEKPKNNEIEYEGNAFRVPSDITPIQVFISENLTTEQLMHAVDSFQRVEENIVENDVSDRYIILNASHGSMSTINRHSGGYREPVIYPDDYEDRYYPAGKMDRYSTINGNKPDIGAIRTWVSDVKFAGKSQRILEMEYGRMYGVANVSWDSSKRERLVKGIAYLVARKIWYVGRKPSDMGDGEWDDDTRDMRPDEGSFSKNERWVNGFTYNKEYSYSSGDEDYH